LIDFLSREYNRLGKIGHFRETVAGKRGDRLFFEEINEAQL
jgi:hypothetical protein